jgi:hypothetical protein
MQYHKVVCRWKGNNWWTGKVIAKHATEDKYDTLYDDNTNDTNLGRAEYKVKPTEEMLQKWRQVTKKLTTNSQWNHHETGHTRRKDKP